MTKLAISVIEDVNQRVAIAALIYSRNPVEADYDLGNEVNWCLEDVPEDVRAVLREITEATITDPTNFRETFLGTIYGFRDDQLS